MLKYITLIIYFLTFQQLIYSQTFLDGNKDKESLHFSLSSGAIFPVGDISSKDASLNSSGYAHTGFNMELNFGFNLVNSWDFVVKGAYFYMGTNIDGLFTSLMYQYQMFGDTISYGHWNILGILAGVSYNNKIAKRIYIENSLYSGFLNFQPREIEFYYHNFIGVGTPADVKYSESSTVQIAFNYSFLLGYRISKSMSLGIGLDYLYSRPKFNLTKKIHELDKDTEYKTTFTRNINLINLNLNIRYSVL
jgi:hypothetical protein